MLEISRRLTVVCSAAVLALAMAACGGGGGGGGPVAMMEEMPELTPAEQLAAAQQTVNDAQAAVDALTDDSTPAEVEAADAALAAAKLVLTAAETLPDNLIAELRKQVADLTSQVETLEMRADVTPEEVAGLHIQIADLTDRVTYLSMRPDITQADLDGLNAQIEGLMSQVAELMMRPTQAEVDGLNDQIVALTGEKGAAEAEVTRLSGELDIARGSVDRLTTLLDTATDNAAAIQMQLAMASANVARLEGELATATSNLATTTTALDTASADVTRLTGELADAAADLTTAQAEVTRLEGELADAKAGLGNADARVIELEGELATASTNLAMASTNVTRLEGELATVTGERDVAMTERDLAITARDEARTAQMTAQAAANEAARLQALAEAARKTAEDALVVANQELTQVKADLAQAQTDLAAATKRAEDAEAKVAELEAAGEADAANVKAIALAMAIRTQAGDAAVPMFTITRTAVDGVEVEAEGFTSSRATTLFNPQGGPNWPGTVLSNDAQSMTVWTDIEEPGDMLFKNRYTPAQLLDVFDTGQNQIEANLLESDDFPAPSSTNTYGEDERSKSFMGSLDGVPGVFTCTTGGDCMITADGDGEVSSTNDWSFVANAPNTATVKEPDADYRWFGWWLDAPAGDDPTYRFQTFFGGQAFVPVAGLDAVEGTATFKGRGAGRYVTQNAFDGAANAGLFHSDVTLTADFDGANAGTIEGDLTNFRDIRGGGNDPLLDGWSVELMEAPLNDVTFEGVAEAKIRSATATGTWNGGFFGTRDDGYPRAVLGEFEAHFEAGPADLAGVFVANNTKAEE